MGFTRTSSTAGRHRRELGVGAHASECDSRGTQNRLIRLALDYLIPDKIEVTYHVSSGSVNVRNQLPMYMFIGHGHCTERPDKRMFANDRAGLSRYMINFLEATNKVTPAVGWNTLLRRHVGVATLCSPSCSGFEPV